MVWQLPRINPLGKILGVKKDRRSRNMAFKPETIKKIEDRGYQFLEVGSCPNCGGKSAYVHASGVVKGVCENDDWHPCGFGGPNVRSWSAAVAHDSLPYEEARRRDAQAKQEIRDKQDKLKKFLLEE